jgi:hypothetical protein
MMMMNDKDPVLNTRIVELLEDRSLCGLPIHKELTDACNKLASSVFNNTQLALLTESLRITDDEVNTSATNNELFVVYDQEPWMDGALDLTARQESDAWYKKTPKYQVTLKRFVTPQLLMDVDELRAEKFDLRDKIAEAATGLSTLITGSFVVPHATLRRLCIPSYQLVHFAGPSVWLKKEAYVLTMVVDMVCGVAVRYAGARDE